MLCKKNKINNEMYFFFQIVENAEIIYLAEKIYYWTYMMDVRKRRTKSCIIDERCLASVH